MKDLKYCMVALQRRGVVFMIALLGNTRTYLVGLRPANFTFTLLPLIYLCVLVAVIRRAVETLTSLIVETHCPPSYNITGIVLLITVKYASTLIHGLRSARKNWLCALSRCFLELISRILHLV